MPEINIEKRITRKLVILVILFSSIITFVATGFQLYRDYEQSLEVVHSNFNQLEGTHLPSIKEAVWNLDVKQVSILLDGIVALQDIRYAEIRDKEGNIISVKALKSASGETVYDQKYAELIFNISNRDN